MEWSPLCFDHVQRKDYFYFQVWKICEFSRLVFSREGVETENGSYKSNLLLKRRNKKDGYT